jgi:CheY-like chemotaxis protein
MAETLPLSGLRILVAEDESLISLLAEDMLMDAGVAEVVIAASMAEAKDALATRPRMDAAVLDVKLGMDSGLELGAVLIEQSIPFVFATGLGPDGDIPASFANVPILQKPYTGDDLVAAIAKARSAGR